jgi:sugar phosphate isomerase/epimerase
MVSAMVMPVAGNGYRAWSDGPYPASAEGATRDEALAKLQRTIEGHVRDGVEVVQLPIGVPVGRPPAKPIWPDDEITRNWLEGIQAARAAADARPDPWDQP